MALAFDVHVAAQGQASHLLDGARGSGRAAAGERFHNLPVRAEARDPVQSAGEGGGALWHGVARNGRDEGQ